MCGCSGGGAIALGLTISSEASASSAPPAEGSTTVAPEPYEAARAWAYTLTNNITVTAAHRLILTGISRVCSTDMVSGELNGTTVSYGLDSFDNDSAAQLAGYSDALDDSSSITATCSGSATLVGYLGPLR
jgi:hypothetical protein